MNALLNYLLEANLGLCLFILVYRLFLKNETDFRWTRAFILIALLVSITFPLLHFNNAAGTVVPSLGDYIPATWLPEFVITADGNPLDKQLNINFDAWFITNLVYSIGVIVSLTFFLIRLGLLLRTMYTHNVIKHGKFLIVESASKQSSFSFFQFIFIGQADQLSHYEKQLIIDHERVHVQRFHSIDILIINVLGIFFWFNPVIKMYKKILVQLHEFEADARAAQNRDVNTYCTLLAKVALMSADYKLANHFSNSLTIKRIEMMRTLKSKIKSWKIVALASILPLFFFAVACNDQVMSDVTDIAKNSTNALIVPENVQARFDQLKRENPNATYIMVELNDAAQQKLATMEQHNKIKSIEIFKTGEPYYESTGKASIKAEADNIKIRKADKRDDDTQTFAILEYNEMASQISENSKQEGDIFTVVEEQATYHENGIEGLMEFLGKEIVYPEKARKAGIQGSVFISMIVEKDGSVSDVQVLKGVDPSLDEEAKRVVSLTKWIAGKQSGKVVRTRFVVPIKYAL